LISLDFAQSVLCIVFSGISFTYEGEALAAEIILIFILAGLEAVRIFLGTYNFLFFFDRCW